MKLGVRPIAPIPALPFRLGVLPMPLLGVLPILGILLKAVSFESPAAAIDSSSPALPRNLSMSTADFACR